MWVVLTHRSKEEISKFALEFDNKLSATNVSMTSDAEMGAGL